jgi:ATP-dependent DNA helicase RecG
MFEVITFTDADAIALLQQEEGHFFDVTQISEGASIHKKIVAFANSDGGELCIGILDKRRTDLRGGVFERWMGFSDVESANGLIASIDEISPKIQLINFDFLQINNRKEFGKVLKIEIEKSGSVHTTPTGKVYVRRGAQCLEITGDEIVNLRLSRGVLSHENQTIPSYSIENLVASKELNGFLSDFSPKTDPETFLQKQHLVKKTTNGDLLPILAAVLLYDENPSAVLVTKCAVKIVRYNTNDKVPLREHLGDQEVIEGPIHVQIEKSLKVIQKIITGLPIMGPKGLEKARYPLEAIKEILVNAIIHRDYNVQRDVVVLIFNNRIEITSPGSLPSTITVDNILNDQFSRNPKIVRLLSKYSDKPNKDIGEGLNTAFQKMKEVRLREPIILASDTSVTVILPHETLAAPEEQILEYLRSHREITNPIAREITGIRSENAVKACFYRLRDANLIEMIPERRGSKSAWRLRVSNIEVEQNLMPKSGQQLPFRF